MRILRLNETLARTGDTRSPHYSKVTSGHFTRPIKLGGRRASGWPQHEVDAIVTARIAGASDSDLATLVNKLHATRSQRFAELLRSLEKNSRDSDL